MIKRMTMKKYLVCLALAVFIMAIVQAGTLAQRVSLTLAGVTVKPTVDANVQKLTIEDFADLSEVTSDFVDAYNDFLNAKTCYHSCTYASAAVKFENIASTSPNPELKLRSWYLAGLSRFLDKDIHHAYVDCLEALALSKKLRSTDPVVFYLDKTVVDMQKNKGYLLTSIGRRMTKIAADQSKQIGQNWCEDILLFSEQTLKSNKTMKKEVRQ